MFIYYYDTYMILYCMRRIRTCAIRCKYKVVRYNKKQKKFLFFHQKKFIAITYEPYNNI